MRQPTHYEISKTVAGVLGYEVVNPNEAGGIYYINGANLDGSAGYLAFKKGPAGEVLKTQQAH